MTANAQAALDIARTLGPVLPLCPGGDTCPPECGGKWDDKLKQMVAHTGNEIGKAPIGKLVKAGVKDATTNSATIDRWWRTVPNANVGLDLERSRVLFVDPDSSDALAEARANGIEGGVQRDSRNVGWLFKRPDGCPVLNISKSADHTDLELRTVGYAVVGGTHANGTPVRINPYQPLQDAPVWAVDRLKAKAAEKATQDAIRQSRRAERSTHEGDPPVRLHARGLRRWSGELVQTKNGKTDRSDSLYYLALDLAECNATEATIRAALEDRDAALGWNKYTGRDDADQRYQEIAEKAVAYVIDREQQPQLRVTKPAEVPDDVTALRAALEEAEATITRLRRRILDADDRLEVLEDIVHSIDDVLCLPNEQASASDKVILIGTARWLPSYRSKKEANGQPTTVSLGYVAKVCGSSKSTVSATLKRFSSEKAESGAAFLKVKHRVAHVDEDGHPIINPKTGKPLYTTPVEFVPLGTRPAETLSAAVAQAKANPRKKHGGSQEASDARWGRCDKHDNREVRIKGYCPDCGKVLGERLMTVAEFDLLDEQLAHPEQAAPTCVGSNPIAKQVAHPDAPIIDSGDADAGHDVQVVDSGAADLSWLDRWPDAPDFEPEEDDDTNVVMLPPPDQRKAYWSRREYRAVAGGAE